MSQGKVEQGNASQIHQATLRKAMQAFFSSLPFFEIGFPLAFFLQRIFLSFKEKTEGRPYSKGSGRLQDEGQGKALT